MRFAYLIILLALTCVGCTITWDVPSTGQTPADTIRREIIVYDTIRQTIIKIDTLRQHVIIQDTVWRSIELDLPIEIKRLSKSTTIVWEPNRLNLAYYGTAVKYFELACLHNGKLFTGWPVQSDTTFTIKNLPKGVYVMMVRAVGTNGVPSAWHTSLDTCVWRRPWIGVQLEE